MANTSSSIVEQESKIMHPRWIGLTRFAIWLGTRAALFGLIMLIGYIKIALTGEQFLEHSLGTSFGLGLLLIFPITTVMSAVWWLALEVVTPLRGNKRSKRALHTTLIVIAVLAIVLDALTVAVQMLLWLPNYWPVIVITAAAALAEAWLLAFLYGPLAHDQVRRG